MLLNGAYLVEGHSVDELRALVGELEATCSVGARVELTGPWPPYNFVAGGDDRALSTTRSPSRRSR